MIEIEATRSQRQIEFVAKEDGEFVGRIFLIAPLHLEGPEVAMEYRGTMAFKRLVDAGEAEAKSLGVSELLAFGASSQMEDYIQRLGYERMPFSVWKKVIRCQ